MRLTLEYPSSWCTKVKAVVVVVVTVCWWLTRPTLHVV